MDIDIQIDNLTDCLIKRATGEKCKTTYSLLKKKLTKTDADNLKRSGWNFDWSVPQKNNYSVYQLFLKENHTLQGMIALKHYCNQQYTHIDIVEAAPFNIGSKGQYIGVGGHLFAIACKLSWNAGNEGFVQFTSKIDLVDHYIKTLHAHQINWNTLYIDTEGAAYLINKYFQEED